MNLKFLSSKYLIYSVAILVFLLIIFIKPSYLFDKKKEAIQQPVNNITKEYKEHFYIHEDSLHYYLGTISHQKEKPNVILDKKDSLKEIKIISLTTTILPFLQKLGKLNHVIAISEMDYVQDSALVKQLKQQNAINLGPHGAYSYETIINLKPDYVVLSCDFDFEAQQKLESFGIKTLCLDEYKETHPLASAKWIIYIASLFHQQKQAQTYFDSIEARYERTRKMIPPTTVKPVVMAGEEINGQWFIPGGKSVLAQLIKDAGGEYLWKDNTQEGSFQISLEEVLSKNEKAQYWRYVYHHPEKEFNYALQVKNHPNYQYIKSFKNKKVVYCNTFYADLFGKALLEPDQVLKDWASILHPTVFKSQPNKYYQF